MMDRRQFLTSTALVLLSARNAQATSYFGGSLPWDNGAVDVPVQVQPGGWIVFTADEGRAVEAISERLIPGDELSISGKEAGCAVFIDRQLAGHYGSATRLYMRPPFLHGLPTQGDQSELAPLARYRYGLAALDRHCRSNFSNAPFAQLSPDQKDSILRDMETGKVAFTGPVAAADFFKLILQNTTEGFFADPIYGGNKDMASWKMLGFPGVRYDFREHVSKHNQRYPLPPVSIMGRAEWKGR